MRSTLWKILAVRVALSLRVRQKGRVCLRPANAKAGMDLVALADRRQTFESVPRWGRVERPEKRVRRERRAVGGASQFTEDYKH